jgi:hypothetical protein
MLSDPDKTNLVVANVPMRVDRHKKNGGQKVIKGMDKKQGKQNWAKVV